MGSPHSWTKRCNTDTADVGLLSWTYEGIGWQRCGRSACKTAAKEVCSYRKLADETGRRSVIAFHIEAPRRGLLCGNRVLRQRNNANGHERLGLSDPHGILELSHHVPIYYPLLK